MSIFTAIQTIWKYLSNRLASISLPAGVANNASGYNALGYTIGYDANGNMTSQQDKGISAIQYNLLNLASVMTTAQGTISYIYAADGTKLRKAATSKTVDYLNGFQYETSQSTTSLQFIPTAEGYFDFAKNKYIYSYKDHLGNVRLSYFRNTNGSAEVLEENNYYPFGLKHEGYNALAGNNSYQYKYNGVEMQTESGMYAMDWRNYMPELGRFSGMDMLSEFYNDSTPYHFASNNPVFYSDPTGMYTNTHSGYLFTDTAEIAALQQYFGNGGSVSSLGGFMSGNETFKEDIPGITFNGKGNSSNWNLGSNYLFNSYTMYNAILQGLNGWNFQTKANAMAESLIGMRSDGPIKYMGGAGDPFAIWEGLGIMLSSSDNKAMNLAALPLLVVTKNGDDALKLLAAEKGILNAEAKAISKEAVAANGTLTTGPFAGEGVPATNRHSRNFTSAQRQAINEQGYTLGCHTCGQTISGTKSGNFILDHQPANAFVPNGWPQTLYPHCKYCSASQGGIISGMKKQGILPKITK